MNQPPSMGPGCEPDHSVLPLDDACDRFEADWRKGCRPRVEDFLDERGESERAKLLRWLLQVEVELRHKDGDVPTPDEYLRRFPGHPEVIAEVFAASSVGAGPVGTIRIPTSHGRPGDGDDEARVPGGSGRVVGGSRFRILSAHAQGGLGKISVAWDEELGREVAVKEIHRDRADDESRGRFVREAKITGNLEHPGIVPVYALGEFGDGRPFYAMRFIRGESLKQAIARFHAADVPGRDPGERVLALRNLLRRFIDVCNAIAFAHSRGVLHRDIKPGNIMIGEYGETLVVDWGLAKAVGGAEGGGGAAAQRVPRPHSAGGSMPTVAGSALGTPAYMSPEQAAGELDRLGPRSDVYSLGATLYCLLTGKKPLGDRGGDIEELLRRARAGDVPPARMVMREVPPALEAVCRKAMAPRPEDRYDSARALADDVERWLADEPVAAWREPRSGRALRWARRHRTPVAASLVAMMAAVLGLGAATVVQARVNDQLMNAKAMTDRALDETRRAKSDTQATLKFFQDKVLAAARPKEQEGGLGIDATIRAAVDAAEPGIEKSFGDQPAVEASIRHTLGETYLYLGDLNPAIRQHDRALALRRWFLGPDHSDTLRSMSDLAVTYQAAGRLADALPLFQESLARRRSLVGRDHPDSLVALSDLAQAYLADGRLTEAVPMHEEALKGQRARLGSDAPDTLQSMNFLAQAYQEAGRLTEALPLFQEALKRRQATLGSDHPSTLESMNNLALAYRGTGRAADVLLLQEELLARTKARLGIDHPHTLTCMNNLANSYQLAGRLADALPLYKEELERCRAKVGSDHPDTFISLNNLARAYQNAGRLAEAIPLFRQSLDGRRARMGPEHPATFLAMNNLGVAYERAGRTRRGPAIARGGAEGSAGQAPPRPSRHAPLDGQPGARRPGRPSGRGRAARARMPGDPGAAGTGRLAHLRDPRPARRQPAGPEEVRRGRAAPARELRGPEGPGSQDTGPGQEAADPGRRPDHPALRGVGQARRGGGVEGTAGPARPARRRLRPAVARQSSPDRPCWRMWRHVVWNDPGDRPAGMVRPRAYLISADQRMWGRPA